MRGKRLIMKKRFFSAANMGVPLGALLPGMTGAASSRKSRGQSRHVQPAMRSDMHAVGQR